MNLASLESLKIFCDVVRQRSFSRGAAMNQVSQSAASQAVSQLEKRLGVRLIDRSKRPFSLTPEGETYYRECSDIVDRYLALEARIRTGKSETVGRVNVASIYSVVLYLNRYVQRFLEQHAGAQVRFQYLHPDDVYESVLNEQADVGLLSFPRIHRGLEIIPWREEPMVLVCSPNHPFADRAKVSPKDLNGEESFIAFDSGLTIRRHIDRLLRRHKISVQRVMEFDNIEFIKRGIETHTGVSILPEPTVRSEVENGSLKIVNMPELDLDRTLCIIHRKRRVLTPAMRSFIGVLKGEVDGVPPARDSGKPPKAGERGPRILRDLPGVGWR